MEREKTKGIIEAELFSAGRPITVKEFAMNLDIEPEQITDIIGEMENEYKEQGRGIEIVKLNGRIHTCEQNTVPRLCLPTY